MGPGNVPWWTAVLKVVLTDTQGSWVQAGPGEAWQLEGGYSAQTKEGLGGLGCLSLCSMVPATLGLGWAGCEDASPGHRYEDPQESAARVRAGSVTPRVPVS